MILIGEKEALRGVTGDLKSVSDPGVSKPLLRSDTDDPLFCRSPRSLRCFPNVSLGEVTNGLGLILLSYERAEVRLVSAGEIVVESEKSENVAWNGVGKGDDIWRTGAGGINGVSGFGASIG